MLSDLSSSRVRAPLVFAIAAVVLSFVPLLAAVEFKHALDDSPLDMSAAPGEILTDAVKQFHDTGSNPYDGDESAFAEGMQLYNDNCQVCHGKVAEGRMCPSLVDDKFAYPRVANDVGMFEVIYGGAAGAMRSFKDRLTQDQILRVIAYVRSVQP